MMEFDNYRSSYEFWGMDEEFKGKIMSNYSKDVE